MNYAELKQKKEAIEQERSHLEAELAKLDEQEHAAEQEFLAGLAVVKVGDRVLYRDEEYEVTGYSNFMVRAADGWQNHDVPEIVVYNCQRVLIHGGLSKKVIELPASRFKVVATGGQES